MSLKQLKSGKWQADYHDRSTRLRKSFNTKTEARMWLKIEQGKKANGESVGIDRNLISECFKSWLAWLPNAENPRSESYILRSKLVYRTIMPWLKQNGYTKVSTVEIKVIHRYQEYRRKQGRASQTILNEIRTLIAALNWNVNSGWIKNHPLINYRPGGGVKHKVRRVATPKELQKVFDCLETEDIKKLIYALLVLGGRFASVAALSTDDIQPGGQRIHFRTAVKAGRDYKRSLPDFPFSLPEKGYLFSNNGDRWKERGALHRLQKACRDSGIEKMNLHDLRHCFATYRLSAGDSVQQVMALGGWRSIKILDNYVDFAKDYQSLLDPKKQDGYLPHWNKTN